LKIRRTFPAAVFEITGLMVWSIVSTGTNTVSCSVAIWSTK
jgi:hypothetical protein